MQEALFYARKEPRVDGSVDLLEAVLYSNMAAVHMVLSIVMLFGGLMYPRLIVCPLFYVLCSLSYTLCSVFLVLYSLSCVPCPVAILCPVFLVLYSLFCVPCPVFSVLCSLSCILCSVFLVLYSLSCVPCPTLSALCSLS